MSKLLNELRKIKKTYDVGIDRGTMVSLRGLLVENKKHLGYPVLYRMGINIDDGARVLIAGLFSTHPMEIDTGNIGTTCKTIETRRNEIKTGEYLTPTERRFSSLIAWDDWDDLSDRLIRIVLMAKSQNVPINYEQLEKDLIYREKSRIEWASSFWGYTPKPKTNEGDFL